MALLFGPSIKLKLEENAEKFNKKKENLLILIAWSNLPIIHKFQLAGLFK